MPAPTENAAELLARLCDPAAVQPIPSVMVVLAHPDDETVGAASLLPRFTLATLVYVTDGAPRDPGDAQAAGCASADEYANLRRGELLSALDDVGVPATRLEFVGCVEQEVIRQVVPLALWLEILMRDLSPALVLTHPYEGGHPDHDATALAAHAAQARIEASGDEAPEIAEFTSYHSRDGQWQFGEFLPGTAAEAITRRLGAHERALKRRLLGCFASQRGVLDLVPLEQERFRVAPEYDFSRPPHAGPLLYEQYPWAVTGSEWRARAVSALERLGTPSRVGDATWHFAHYA